MKLLELFDSHKFDVKVIIDKPDKYSTEARVGNHNIRFTKKHDKFYDDGKDFFGSYDKYNAFWHPKDEEYDATPSGVMLVNNEKKEIDLDIEKYTNVNNRRKAMKMQEENHNRPRFYKKLCDRLASKYGFKYASDSDKTVQWLKKNMESEDDGFEVLYLVAN